MRSIPILSLILLPMALTDVRAEVDFQKDILPVFEAKCLECHSAQKGAPKGGLRLDTLEGIQRGSKHNRIIEPGKPEESLILKLVSLPNDDVDLMPPTGKGEPLSAVEVGKLKQWIAEGCNFGDWTAFDFSAKPAKPKTPAKPSAAAVPATPHAAPDPNSIWARPSPVVPDTTVQGAARQIDNLVEAGLKANKVAPNRMTDDAAFLRRVYLDAAGRIPSYEETNTFLDSSSPSKRTDVINQILASEAYVSRQYDYWADLLRVQTRMRQVSGENYQRWLKDSIRTEKPYDNMVRELITAEGHIYENGASGYYLRDAGMPLDNMANTVQIFLGTSLACAQCHNHPFDKWTQKEFYEMAAFTNGVQTVRPGGKEDKEKYRMIATMDLDSRVIQAVKSMVRKTRYGYVSDDEGRQLRLPEDYKYEDAAPKSRVSPGPIFSDGSKGVYNSGRRQAYAEWMTSPENPRFTINIANRLWRQAMGLGLIEPVDDLKDDSAAYNPDLMAYLAELMRKLDYNQKEFLRIIYNTQAYQRESSIRAATSDEPYYFPGPVMRRMSAEQLWDSILSLIVPNVDERTDPQREKMGEDLEMLERIRQMTAEELVRTAEEVVQRKQKGRYEKSGEMEEQMQLGGEGGPSVKKKKSPNSAGIVQSQPTVMAAPNKKSLARAKKPEKARREPEFPRGFVRASELQQPAPAGHFLEEFGQSDRETIQGSHTSATVTQILNLMNGPAYNELAKSRSVLSQTLAKTGGTPSDKAEAIFLSIYSERPTDEELAIATEALARDPKNGLQDLTWALLNTQRFMFIP